MKIYLVTCSEGEYSDRTEWVHSAYKDEQQAKNKVNELSAISRECYLKCIESDFDYVVLEEFIKKYPDLYISDYISSEIKVFLNECNLY